MSMFLSRCFFILIAFIFIIPQAANAAEQGRGNLVSVQWLEQNGSAATSC
jgi:hypothetical protein